ncbi:MAG: Xaa-Pro peptidase family protein [Streptosporangiales bacterium]|nr:Xaa-Pro peptidase family protein [Streptosporangiales bacterium]
MALDALPPAPPAPAPPAPAPEREHADRISALRQQMKTEGIAAVAAASPENIYYLTGLDHLGYFAFTLLVIGATGQPVLVARTMETPTIRAQVPWCRHLAYGDGDTPAGAAVTALAAAAPSGSTVALDEDSMFFPPAVAAAIRAARPGERRPSASSLLARQRAVKSPAEVYRVRQAALVSDQAMAAGLAAARPGASERAVAAGVYRTMIEAGGEPPGFPPLIRPVTRLDTEHVSWSGDGLLRPGTGLFFELSASVRRYHAPQSRVVYLGHAPREAAGAAESALAGLIAARDALRPGTATGDVYAAWERVVGGAASGGPLRHHCGYLVGIGFPPSWVGGGEVLGIRPGGQTLIVPGMTFHLMSWVTRPAGHVISDTVLVTADGAELLTGTPRELTVLD